MKILSLSLGNIRSYKGDNRLDFSRSINLLVGPNNSGKSTIIWALKLLQNEQGRWAWPNPATELRLGASEGYLGFVFDYFHPELSRILRTPVDSLVPEQGFGAEFGRNRTGTLSSLDKDHNKKSSLGHQIEIFSPKEPNNLFFLFLSRRKPDSFQEGVNADAQSTVRDTMMFLPAKIDRLTNSSNHRRSKYENYLRRVLGFQLATKGGSNGKIAGMYVGDEDDFIPIERMGEGVPNIAYLLHDLAVAKDRVFLIEEPENDLHPSALIALLDIISECASSNQFIISTHSHIVVSRLGALANAKTFKFQNKPERDLPCTVIEAIPTDSPAARIHLLQDLGYEMYDFGHWEGVLILEESSAERVIRDILIPHFAPKLAGRLRTVAANSISRVEMTYDALHTSYLFLHLSPVYQTKSWVRIDGGPDSELILGRLRQKYRNRDTFQFMAFSEGNFEKYYPGRFQAEADRCLGIENKKEKQEAKRLLLLNVLDWSLTNPADAKTEFGISSSEVINELREIEKRLLG